MSSAADPPSPSEAHIGLKLLLVLGGLASFGPLSIDMYLPALPRIGADLDASAASIALTLTACTIGLGAGQLVAGPLSDTFGRRRPLFVGLLVFVVFSLACAAAPDLWSLVAFRFLQALGGSAGIVISRAVARDLRSGVALARLFSALMVVNGLAPILAPVIGGQLVRVTSWRGVFVVLAVIGALLMLAAALFIPESLPPPRRQPGSLAVTGANYLRLISDLRFMLHVVAGGLAFAAMFAYISGSPFVLEDYFGLSPQMFSLIFGINASGIIIFSRLRWPNPRGVMLIGLGLILLGATLVLIAALTGVGLPLVLPGFFLITSGYGAAAPNVTALALADHPDVAGSAAAVYGAVQFVLGGLLAPLAGIGGRSTLVPLGIVLVLLALAALACGSIPGWASGVSAAVAPERASEQARETGVEVGQAT
ncbi:multidrug effflux MFS transporter [Jatrophihabitans sp. GAS493]|uniref:multidrug effflux MFS transporter n=1 Tax=Jatrophihabitans sp. GAS493 TaxID=1907575 RepID=UPI000BB8394F|nr:multidrug effflux MFS transporter [Jatrophihabitans sp. GAS493]